MKKQRWRFTKSYRKLKCWDCEKTVSNKHKKRFSLEGLFSDDRGYIYVICKECASKEELDI